MEYNLEVSSMLEMEYIIPCYINTTLIPCPNVSHSTMNALSKSGFSNISVEGIIM